jgi:hypothetical protein
VVVLMWPPGEFKRLPRGTTAGHVVKTHVRLHAYINCVHRHRAALHQPCSPMTCHNNLIDACVALQGLLQISGRNGSGMLNVNNRLVPETTMLSDGDLVIISDELLSI